ncbi:MAG: hypothetical protein QM530_05650 [Phycisphaerales bacterium]|nr:hypothetical protein [Phycisphaerales bacterium]
MKLESLKSSKFEAFKGSEIVNAMSIKGGACQNTYASKTANLPSDSIDCGTNNSKTLFDGCDFYDTICTVGPSEGQGIIGDPSPTPTESGATYNSVGN